MLGLNLPAEGGCARVVAMVDLRHRFPGITEGVHRTWARFDGPAGTQVLDSAIQATSAWQRSGNNANSHGSFAAADACDALVADTQAVMGKFLNADADSFMFGPSTTSNIFSITRAIARELRPGDEIVCTRLDHDSNVSPWLLIAADTGAIVRFADFDATTGRLATSAIEQQLTARTKWVAVTGASNAIGTMPDIPAISAAAHAVGAKVVVDGVHLTPHAPVDIAVLGCDVYSTSAYKWYGPHMGITWVEAELLDRLQAYKVRPAPTTGPGKFMLGTPAYENIASVGATAAFLIELGMDTVRRHESAVFTRLLDGLLADDRITVLGPHDLASRAPTLAFNVAGLEPDHVARKLAADQVAVWDGDYYAIELMGAFGLTSGAVRAGIALYVTDDDVDRLLESVSRL